MKRGKKALVLFLAVVMVITSVPAIAAPGRVTNPYTDSYTESRAESVYNRLGDVLSKLFGKDFESYATTDSVEAADLSDSSQNDSSANMKKSSEEVNNGSEEVSNGSARQSKELEKRVKSSSNRKNSSNSNKKESKAEQELVLVEDATTVENGEMLRASTYNLETVGAETAATYDLRNTASTADVEETAEETTVKYFPVTMYDYNTDDINAATDAEDDDLTVREGMYFSGGSPTYEKTSIADMSSFVAGQYYIQNIRAKENITDGKSWLQAHEDNKIYAVTKENATVWTLVIENDEYYLKATIDGVDNYMVVGTNGDTDGYTTTKTPISITAFSGNSRGVQLSQNGYYLCQWGGITMLDFGGYKVNNDDGNGFLFYPVDSDTPITPGESIASISSGYEEWNRWDKASGNNDNGDLIYTGLVQSTLVDDQIQFNVNEGGIFSYTELEVVGTDGTVSSNNPGKKQVYEYVGLPFVLKEDGVYSFDSDVNGAYFAETTDKTARLKSGTSDAPYNMHFAENAPQPMPTGLSVGDGSTNAWLPFNAETSYETSQVNYHMGMRADIPFSMTANGRIKSTDDESKPITFTFSGDDDVWVFIDGQLVIDLGGIHNRLDATIDFAANTVTYSEENSQDDNTTTGSYNDSKFAATQKLFTEGESTGLINMTREVFAMDEDHEMQVFYLERGEGTSNCRIEFNLPMHDAVLVTKDATQSWYENWETSEDQTLIDNEGVEKLSAVEQAIVNNMLFGMTLYKKDEAVENATFAPVANTDFYVLDATGTVIDINSTDAAGRFYLKNGQTAKFITDIPSTGITYYVIEDKVPDGFFTPDFNFDGMAANGFEYYDSVTDGAVKTGIEFDEEKDVFIFPEHELPVNASTYKSYEMTVYGSVEANDYIEFICTNFVDANLPNPSAFTEEDIIVIDYGLPVQIDPLANDLIRGDYVEILYVGGDNVTLETKEDTEGINQPIIKENDKDVTLGEKIENKEFDSGNVTLTDTKFAIDSQGNITDRDTLTYTLTKQLTEVEVLSYVIEVQGSEETEATGTVLCQKKYALGKIYIVPATVMYYEENFSDLVTFTGNGWETEEGKMNQVVEDLYVSEYQEPGVVGTKTDSTYGSDVAYLSDSQDSNGTSYYGDTTKGAIRFSYTFTGTGTSIFARTSDKTGYMQIKLYEGTGTSGKQLNMTYRDTYYKDQNASSEDAAGTLYNIPVYTESDLDYGTYTVVATVAKAGTKTAGNDNGSGNEFYLDGIRIMQPLNENITYTESGDALIPALTQKALGAYATDGESNIEVVTLRQKLITDAELNETPWNFAVLTDIDGEVVTAEDYTSIGPKEEVYLKKGQSVSFAIKYWHQDGYKMYLGMKAPFGIGTAQVGQTTYNLENATDCYYDITGNHSSVAVKYEQAMDEAHNLLYTDANGNSVYEDKQGNFKYVSDNSLVLEDTELTPVYDMNKPYYVATYTITATEKIVSLTNIKVTGNYEFAIVEDINIDMNGDTNGGEQ